MLHFADFEKAFERLNWDFIQHTLKNVRFNKGFCQWIRTMFAAFSASVCNNSFTSHSLEINRGVRQGCLLITDSFIICFKLSAMEAKQNASINEEYFNMQTTQYYS